MNKVIIGKLRIDPKIRDLQEKNEIFSKFFHESFLSFLENDWGDVLDKTKEKITK